MCDVRGRNRPLKIPPPGIREGVPSCGAISDFVFARIGFIDELPFEEDGVGGFEFRRRVRRMLDPAMYGLAHIDRVSKKGDESVYPHPQNECAVSYFPP